MPLSILLCIAFANGIVIGLCRVINARLSENEGPLRTSFWNHGVGFLVLLAVVGAARNGAGNFASIHAMRAAPPAAYLGGILGVGFVAINSAVLANLGAMRTVLLVTCGQMLMATLLDVAQRHIASIGMQVVGVMLILVGILASRKAAARPPAADQEVAGQDVAPLAATGSAGR